MSQLVSYFQKWWQSFLEVLSIFAFEWLFLVGHQTFALIAIYLIFTTTYIRWILLLYAYWIFFIDHETRENGGRPSKWVKNWPIWKYMSSYFPTNIIKEKPFELDPERNYLFIHYPHGLLAISAFSGFMTEGSNISKIFPHHQSHMHTLNANFISPITREIFLSTSAVSASAKSLNYILGKEGGGNFALLSVGGAQEAYYSNPGVYKILLKDRKGYAKMALKHGSPLVPTFAFGEQDVIYQYKSDEGSLIYKFQMYFKSLTGFLPILPVGRFYCPFLPQRVELNIVVGEPLEVSRIEQPTRDQVEELHQKFIKRLIELFENNKHKYLKNASEIQLEIM